MDQLLVDITHAFEPRYRTSKITKLFTIDGDEVFKVDELVESKDSAVSENECLFISSCGPASSPACVPPSVCYS